MDTLDDDHGVDSIRDFVRQHEDIDVHTYVKRGLSGLVYFGKRKKLNDEVVLKFYWSYPEFDSSEEAVILRNIDHPNVLRIFDLTFVKPNASCFLTPRISGGDLQETIETRPISTKEALEITSGILAGVTELHANHNLVHRDLKPANILLDLNKNVPVIADLGAVKKIHSTQGFTTESKATLYYLPPESIIDKKYYFQSDIYQIGLVLFQLLGGHFPINNPTQWLNQKEQRVLYMTPESSQFQKIEEYISEKIFKGKLADTGTLPNYLDPAFKRLLNKALHIDHNKRFKNTSEFLKEIHKLLSNCPNYLNNDNELVITHPSGKEFRILKDNIGSVVLEKKLPGKTWRKDNSHDGNYSAALALAKKG